MVGEPDLPSPLRFFVLASGNGGNFQALVEACAAGRVNGRVAALVSDKKEAFALERAARAGIPGLFLPHFRGMPRREYDAVLAETASAFRPDYVLLLGWMRILSDVFISRFPMRVVNIHPALPGAFPGTQAIERAFEAWRQGRIDRTGVMIHFVPDEGVDDGPVIATAGVAIETGDDPASLEKKVHETEHRLLTETLARLANAQ
jgi:phosphoribosylglycinamide formyltransferase-1